MRTSLCLAALVALAACATDPAPEAYPASDASTTADAATGVPTIVTDSLVVEEPGQQFTFAVSFPQIADPSTDPQRAANAAIRDSVGAMVDEYLGYTAHPEEDEGSWVVDVSGGPEDTYVSDDVLSTVLAVYAYTGGAHGNMMYVPLTFDLRTGMALTPSDLFAGSGWGDALAAYVEGRVVTQLAERMDTTPDDARSVLFTEGTEQVRTGNVALAVGADSLAIHIAPYQYAAYVFGTFRVAVPRQMLADHARPGGVLDGP